jgi:WD40 repeat protein
LIAIPDVSDLLLHDDTLLIATVDGSIHLRQTTGQDAPFETIQNVARRDITFETIDHHHVLIKTGDNDAGLWNLVDQRFDLQWPNCHKMAVAPSRHQFALASNRGYGNMLFDTTLFEHIWTASGHTAPILDLKFSPDGKWLFSCSTDRSIRVWDLQQKVQTMILRGHECAIERIAVAPDLATLASSDESGCLRLWDLRTGREYFELYRHQTGFRSLQFTDDGSQLIAIDTDQFEFRWDSRDDRSE